MIADLGGYAALIDVGADNLGAIADELGPEAISTYVGSVTDVNLLAETIAQFASERGATDGLINNTGIIRPAMIHKMTADDWQQVIDVNLNGVFYSLQAVGRHMMERAESSGPVSGSIVNVSSIAGRRGAIGQINYGAAKSGVLGITMSAAKEWARYGIRVNSVALGVVETDMTETIRSGKFCDRYLGQIPLGRFSTPRDVVEPVCFLLSDAAGYITGQHLSVDGGAYIGF